MTEISKKPITKPRPTRIPAVLKMAASAGVVGLMLSAAPGAAFAAKPGGPGGGHPGGGAPHPGGGAPHIGGGAPHFGGGAPHFGGGAPHIGGGAPHFAAPHFSAPHVAGHAAPHFAPHAAPHFAPHVAHGHFAPHIAGHASHFGHHGPIGQVNHGFANHGLANHGIANHGIANHGITNNATNNAHGNIEHAHGPSAVEHSLATMAHPQAGPHVLPAAQRAAFHSDPRSFAEHRHGLAENNAFRPFWHQGWHRWHRWYHLGWIGPVFWPYAYGDFFYYALWPDYYYGVDPFWAYGYDDIYSAIFTPNDYGGYVQGPSASSKMAALTQNMAQSCSDEAAEVTGWPIDQIQSAVQPTQQQAALLDDLGNALVKASDEVKANCPTTIAFTPTGRLDQMQQRLQALVQAVNIVSPALDKFYESLSDEQKARFNGIAPSGAKPESASQDEGAQNPQGQCNGNVMNWPGDQIDRVVRPDDAQRVKLDHLQSAAGQASDIIKAACPSDVPATPPARLAAVGKRLNAMLQAAQTVRPALADFYDSLSDDQKARFNTMGKQLFAANSQ